MMKPLFLAGLLLVVTLAGTAARAETAPDNPTAYTALRLVGKELGPDSLNRVVEITGREGVPQPFVWKIVLNEKTGGGLREVEVAGGQLAASRPLPRSARPLAAAAPPVNLRDLNQDSSGVFNVADSQARRVRLAFDALNYTLRVDPVTGKPVWTLQLLDAEHRDLAGLSLAASDGALLQATGRLAGAPDGPAAPGETTAVTTTTTSTAPSRVVVEDAEDRAEGGFFERSGRSLDRTGRRVERTLRKTGGSIGSTFERFFSRESHNESD